ncbi:MAG: carboxyl transferase domain-containing protein [Myxococcota bacterium]
MPELATRIDVRSDAYRQNRDRAAARLDEVRALERRVRETSNAKRERFEGRGQLVPRERVARLLDRNTPFLELCPLAGLGMHDDDGKSDVMGGGSILGIGTVSGVRCLVSASDSGIKGGSIPPAGLRKGLRGQEIAMRHKLPTVSLVESGGANLLYQSSIFIDGGRTFANQARMSAMGLPQVCVVNGSSTAGGAYMPGMSDYVILVRGRSKIFLAGPPLVKAAIGEDADDETLGGAEMHATVTGLGEYLAEDDAHAVAMARELLAHLPWDRATVPEGAPPRFDPEELLGVVPASDREPYDVTEIIARLVDGSVFLPFKANYGADTVCGHARIDGHPVGILGNNGPIQPDGSTKAGQFIQLCDQAQIPLVFLQNTTGYMVGRAAEHAGAIKHGAKMIQAVATARVPKMTIVVGGSYGAGNYGMCGRGFDPNFIFAWPTARTAVMGGAQAAKVMEIVTRAKFARRGQQLDDAIVAHMAQQITDQLDAESTALYGTARLFDDGIIDPRDTRRILSLCLALGREAAARTLQPNTFGVARF